MKNNRIEAGVSVYIVIHMLYKTTLISVNKKPKGYAPLPTPGSVHPDFERDKFQSVTPNLQ